MNRFNNIYSKNIRLIPAILFIIVGVNCSTMAQPVAENSQRTISINMSATELIPADLIIFSININAEEKTPEAALILIKSVKRSWLLC